MEILATFSHFQDEKEVNSRYKDWYYTHLVYYYNNFYFETDGSRIRPLPSTTVNLCNCTNQYICYFNNSVWSMILVWVSWRSSKTEQVKSLWCLKCGSLQMSKVWVLPLAWVLLDVTASGITLQLHAFFYL